MEMARVQTILGPDWNRGFNCADDADDADDTDAKELNPSGLWIRIVSIARVIACRLREMADGIGRPFRKPAARFYRPILMLNPACQW